MGHLSCERKQEKSGKPLAKKRKRDRQKQRQR